MDLAAELATMSADYGIARKANVARPKPLLLMILDGWGHSETSEHNAIAAASTPHWDQLQSQCAGGLIETSGEAVGLPAGQMGNSEVGHMNIGAGRIVFQDFTRISQAIENDELKDNTALIDTLKRTQSASGRVHVMGLLSPGGVHSHEDHIFAVVELAAKSGCEVLVHAFLDGRDTPPQSADESLTRLQACVDALPNAAIATVTGRYYAMDRDNRWDRVAQAYGAIVSRDAPREAASARQALANAYAEGSTDEFVKPTLIGSSGDDLGVSAGDSVLFVNFRADRARELTAAFVQDDFDGFERSQQPELTEFVCFTEYSSQLQAAVAFPPLSLRDGIGQILAEHQLRQLRIAETEKYAHVTFFLNGGREEPFPGEDRTLIPSPDVATYDLQPQMSAPELTEKLVAAIGSQQYDVIICNVANADMVGHTGVFEAAVAAVEAIDDLLGEVSAAIREAGGEMLITADHGNIEQMVDTAADQPHTAHTTNLVPFLYLGRPGEMRSGGALRDIAPTMLSLLGLAQPAAMSGTSLVTLKGKEAAA